MNAPVAPVPSAPDRQAHLGRYDPRRALYDRYPAMEAFARGVAAVKADCIGRLLAEREAGGLDTSKARSALIELRWRMGATSDVRSAQDALERLEAIVDDPAPEGALDQDEDGSFGTGTGEWFIKLDRSTDQLLAHSWPWRRPPVFLDKVNDPARLHTYLEEICCSDVACRGTDTRKELNLAFSVLARLVLRGGQAGWLSGPGFVAVLEAFVRGWQDPQTGCFGMTYVTDDQGATVRTCDLSLTFHAVRYLPHLAVNREGLVETLLSLEGGIYPQGWLDPGGGMSNHNNYDFAELIRRCWRFMRPDQRVRASALIEAMLDWCLRRSLGQDGSVRDPDPGDMLPDAYYFAGAFLDTVGYFERRKRFWADRDYGDAPERLRDSMGSRLGAFNPRLTVVADTLERLGAGRRGDSVALL